MVTLRQCSNPNRDFRHGKQIDPNGKLPDRNDFLRYGTDVLGRIQAWGTAAAASRQLAEELQAWLLKPDMTRVEML